MKLKFLAALACAAILYGCDDTTTGIGDFVADKDKINAYFDTFDIQTNTVSFDDVNKDGKKGIYSRSSYAYLGKYTDPDFGLFTADFITQINCPEGFRYPDTFKGIKESKLELYYSKFYGDSLAPMRVNISLLDKVIVDDATDPNLYYTSLDPKQYANDAVIATKDYTAKDLTVSDSLRNSEGYYPDIAIDLDKAGKIIEGKTFSDYFYNKYASDKSNFDDAETFIKNVLKGFYIHNATGEGSVLYIGDIWLKQKIEYTIRNKKNTADSTVYAYRVFPATKEIFTSTRIENDSRLEELKAEEGHTYIKTPAGLCTEVELPFNNTDFQKLKNDTINSINVLFTKYKNKENEGEFKMGTPNHLLLVRKDDMVDFFEKGKVIDKKTSFLTEYNKSVNGYEFKALNSLVSYIFHEKDNNSENRYKLLLVPVKVDSDNQGKIISITHDLEINAAKLFGGVNGEKIEMKVIYTRPEKDEKK